MSDIAQRLSATWNRDLGHDEQAAILAWGAFTLTFTGVRALTHWIRDGHGPPGGGMSLHGKHVHHYNIGIATLSGLGALLVRSDANQRAINSSVVPVAYGFANALIADEAALLLDLKDVYWSPQGRESVRLAVGAIGVGGFGLTVAPFLKRYQDRRRRGR